ncbi:MAG: Gfo/Idh/MocA family oxidoreductase, partial [Niallia sp.]
PWKVKASKSKENGFPENNPALEEKIQKAYDALPAIPYEGHTGQIHDVLQAVNGEKTVLSNGIQGQQTLEIISAIYQSAHTGKAVKLPLTKEDPFFTRAGILQHAKKR